MSLTFKTTCGIQFLFDGKQTAADPLRHALRIGLKARHINLLPTIEKMRPSCLVVSFFGPLGVVERCRTLVSSMASRKGYRCVKLKDDASEAIREELYPVLSRLECELRSFATKAMIDAMGFEAAYRDIVLTERNLAPKDGGRAYGHSPFQAFESVELRKMVKLIWDGEKTVPDWNKVFEKYFSPPGNSYAAKDWLHQIADTRNAVMHCRTLTFKQMRAAESRASSVFGLLHSRKPEFSRAEARQVARLWRNLKRHTDGLALRVRKELSGLEQTPRVGGGNSSPEGGRDEDVVT